MSRICIGVVTKPQALKGQFRVKPNLINLKTYKKLSEIEIDNTTYSVESVSLRDTFVILKIKGIDSCESAELLRNKEIFADIEQKVEEHFDLQGYGVVVESENIGVIVDINNYGSKDILSIEGNNSCLIPVIDKLIDKIDEQENVVYLNKNIFEQVAVYED
ncbi:MAG: 16S rRNA processing protein RimM [Clostridia bacterium]|nr:16S rRNA processing protein RimM [Clostridia bacterium]